MCGKLEASPELLEELIENFVRERLDEYMDIVSAAMLVGVNRCVERTTKKVELDKAEMVDKMIEFGDDTNKIAAMI